MKQIVVRYVGACALAGVVGMFGCDGGGDAGVPTDLTPVVPADKMPQLVPMVPGKAPSESSTTPIPGKPAAAPEASKTPAK